MHLLKHKDAKPKPLVPIVSRWKIPFTKKMRGKKYDAKGNYIGPSGPPKPIPDTRDIENLRRAQAEAEKLPKPVDGGEFDLSRYRPLPGRVLVKRPPPVKVRNGIELPESLWHTEPYFIVVAIGAGVTVCNPGDRVVFDKRWKPKPVRLGNGNAFHLGKAKRIISLVEEQT